MKRLEHAESSFVSRLSRAGCWAPRDDFERIVSHVLPGETSNSELVLNCEQFELINNLVTRREGHEPIEYIVGSVNFGGISIRVGPGVFVPRQHTEPLLHYALNELDGVDTPVVLDLCAGSGAIGLAIANQRRDACIHLVESDAIAVEWLKLNQETSQARGDATTFIHHQDVGTELDGTGPESVDLIVANPPFVRHGSRLPPEWQDHQPHQALFGGQDGLMVVRLVLDTARTLLRPRGILAVEHDDDQGGVVSSLLRANADFVNVTTRRDHQNRPRFTTAKRKDTGDWKCL